MFQREQMYAVAPGQLTPSTTHPSGTGQSLFLQDGQHRPHVDTAFVAQH
jgi:hypothetical protein